MNKEQLLECLKERARQLTLYEHEDGNAWDASGGNYDDCYEIGADDGEIHFARYLLETFFPDESTSS